MHIKTHEVKQIIVDEINLTPMEWDRRSVGTESWRLHMAKLLNLRVKKLAPQSNPGEFFDRLARFSHEIGFGETDVVVKVTEKVYNVTLIFDQAEQERNVA